MSWEDLVEEGMATHFSILAWRIPWTEEPGGLWSIGSQRVGHDWSDLARICTHMNEKMGLKRGLTTCPHSSSVDRLDSNGSCLTTRCPAVDLSSGHPDFMEFKISILKFSLFSCSVVSDSLRPHESQHARPPCPSPTPGVHSNSRLLSRWCHPAISSSVVPFSSCHQSLPASGSFPMSQLFTWGGQSTGVSASAFLVLPNFFMMLSQSVCYSSECKKIPLGTTPSMFKKKKKRLAISSQHITDICIME